MEALNTRLFHKPRTMRYDGFKTYTQSNSDFF